MEQHVLAPVPDVPENAESVSVTFTGGESYEARVRGHRIAVDQPIGFGGADSAPTPVELLHAVAEHCTVHNTLVSEPSVRIELD
jgi:hypothetical protein